MALLNRKKSYDRNRILGDAATARKTGKTKKALGLYLRVLENEPENPALHRRAAPLLAETKQYESSLHSYRRAVEGLVKQGFMEQATGLYREALSYLPEDAELWVSLADLQVRRDQRPDAIESLLKGRGHFRKKQQLPQAIRLLVLVRKLNPHAFEPNYDLACVLARANARDRAQRILEQLVGQIRGGRLRRVRGKLFWLSPGFGAAWGWIRALCVGR
jgi:tetratricopeptide (TPR) repeat protein